jgi:hypothetical protein
MQPSQPSHASPSTIASARKQQGGLAQQAQSGQALSHTLQGLAQQEEATAAYSWLEVALMLTPLTAPMVLGYKAYQQWRQQHQTPNEPL